MVFLASLYQNHNGIPTYFVYFVFFWKNTSNVHYNDVKNPGTFDLFVPKSRYYIDVYFVFLGKSTSNLQKNNAQKLGIFDLSVAKSN